MKLSKKDAAKLNAILGDLNKVKNYIQKESTIIAGKTNITSLPENTYINKKTGEQIIEFNKNVGTELCYLYNAIEKINYLLNPITTA